MWVKVMCINSVYIDEYLLHFSDKILKGTYKIENFLKYDRLLEV